MSTHAIRRLGLIDVLAIGVNAIVGSGVFSVPDDMQRAMGGFSPLGFLLCAVVLIPVALCFAELSSRSDRTGGPYLYAAQAFGPMVGFLVGWSCYLNAFLSFAANVTQFVSLTGLDGHIAYRPTVVGIVLGLGAINYVGVRPGANLVVLMTVGKLLAILLFVGAALMHLDTASLGGDLPQGATGVANGVYLALFPLQGFEVVPVPAGETKNPKRNVPIATVGALLFAALLFVVVQACLVGSYAKIAEESNTPLVDAARAIGPTLGALVLVGSIVSVGGFSAGSALGSPRYAQALAEGGDLPQRLGAVHARYGTPYVAITVTTLLTAALGAAFTYRQLVGFSNATVVFQYALTCLAVPILRKKIADAPPSEPADGRERGYRSSARNEHPTSGFRVPWGPVLPLFGAIGSLLLLSGSSAEELYWAVGGIALGLVVLAMTRRFDKKPA